MSRGSLKAFLTVAIAGAMLVGFADAASADTGVSAGAAVVVSVTHSQQTLPSASDPVVQRVSNVLKSGGTVDLQDQGRTVAVAHLNGKTLEVTSPVAGSVTTPGNGVLPDYTFCTYATASAILSVGAAVILTIVA